jgi:hypothetical protein
MEALVKDALMRQSIYGSEHPCICVPSEYCHWQCLCEEPTGEQGMEKKEKINVSSGEDAFV